MLDNSFDKTLKEKLEQLRPEYDPSSWESLEEKMEASALDDVVREKLEVLETPYEAVSWSLLQDKMSEVEDTEWDTLVKHKLDQVEVAYDMASWSLLENRIQAMEDEELDDAVREHLTQKAATDEGQSWPDLLARLESWERVRREFWVLRSAETLMLALLLLAFYQYQPEWHNYDSDMLVETALESDSRINRASENDLQMGHETTRKESDVNSTESTGLSETESVRTTVEGGKELSAAHSTLRSKIGSDSSEETDRGGLSMTANQPIKIEEVPVFVLKENLGKTNIGVAEEDEAIEREEAIRSDEVRLNDGLTDFIPALSGWLKSSSIDLEEVALSIPNYRKASRNKIWLSLQSHVALNRVHTPKNEEFDERYAYTNGYGLGLLIGFKNDRLVWESGVEYQLSGFKPKRTKLTGNIIDGYRSTTLSQVNVDYINVPLQMRYIFYKGERHQFYAMAGVKLHISSKIDFDFVEERDDDNIPIDFDSEPEPEDIIGVERGRFTYFSLNAGIGYHYLLNGRTKLFVQPTYEHFAERQGITNLNNERVNTMRVNFGVRVQL